MKIEAISTYEGSKMKDKATEVSYYFYDKNNKSIFCLDEMENEEISENLKENDKLVMYDSKHHVEVPENFIAFKLERVVKFFESSIVNSIILPRDNSVLDGVNREDILDLIQEKIVTVEGMQHIFFITDNQFDISVVE